jgi:hypothetical protein
MVDIHNRHLGQKAIEESIAKGLCEDICKLMLRENMQCLNETKLNLLSNKMTININVFFSLMKKKDWWQYVRQPDYRKTK